MEIQITVNGSKCKQYNFNGKTFIEAKQGSEYVIEAKNNHWKRVLTVGSVDGLNVLTGKTAQESDSGYIVGAYSAEKIKGFRVSDSEWALFKFGYKFNGNTYAQSKEDGSEKNCGVIGIKFFYEKEPIVVTAYNTYGISASYCCNNLTGAMNPHYNSSTGASGISYTSNVNYQANNLGTQDMNLYSSNLRSTNKGGPICADHKISKKRSAGGQSATLGITSNYYAAASAPLGDVDDSLDFCSNEYKKPEFDMGTEFGRKERSTVKNVEFTRGCLASSFDIYYASREALIAMGVPITNELQVNLPQSFPNTYCTPPKNWVG